MPIPQKPKDVFVANAWWLELPGLISPAFETLSGLSHKTGTVTLVDAGTNVMYKFGSQIQDFGSISLTRPMNGSVDDKTLMALVSNSIASGQKYTGTMVKRHWGNIVFSIVFEGLRFVENNFNDFNVESEDKLVQTFQATVDSWLLI